MATDAIGRDAPLVAQHLAEIEPVEPLHDEVDVAVGGGARVGDVDDVGMADLRRRARLAAEARHQIGLPRELRVQDLERDLLADLDVLGLVDRAHAAGAEHALDAVAPVDDARRRAAAATAGRPRSSRCGCGARTGSAAAARGGAGDVSAAPRGACVTVSSSSSSSRFLRSVARIGDADGGRWPVWTSASVACPAGARRHWPDARPAPAWPAAAPRPDAAGGASPDPRRASPRGRATRRRASPPGSPAASAARPTLLAVALALALWGPLRSRDRRAQLRQLLAQQPLALGRLALDLVAEQILQEGRHARRVGAGRDARQLVGERLAELLGRLVALLAIGRQRLERPPRRSTAAARASGATAARCADGAPARGSCTASSPVSCSGRPVSSSHRITPVAKMSVRASACSPRACSGAR